jgi:hypothetical protein
MCTTTTLSQTHNGYVMICNHCNNLQVGFGTTLMSLKTKQFYTFCQQVIAQHQHYKDAMHPDRKAILLDTFSKKFALVLSPNELQNLYELLTEALLMLQVNSILKNTDPSDWVKN